MGRPQHGPCVAIVKKVEICALATSGGRRTCQHGRARSGNVRDLRACVSNRHTCLARRHALRALAGRRRGHHEALPAAASQSQVSELSGDNNYVAWLTCRPARSSQASIFSFVPAAWTAGGGGGGNSRPGGGAGAPRLDRLTAGHGAVP